MSGSDDLQDEAPTSTLTHHHVQEDSSDAGSRRIRIEVLEGPNAGTVVTTRGPKAIAGTHADADLRLDDETVSRRHVELRAVAGGVLLLDLGSKNGTKVAGLSIKEALLTGGEQFQIGATRIRARAVAEPPTAAARVSQFGAYVTCHPPLAASLEMLRRASASDATVLIEGETGTGKELLARAVHAASPRAAGPLVVVDCGGVTASLLESQLFGHRKGAFTGAISDHVGAFEAANGGTVFLDELGELPIDLQPKLLRALEARTVKRVGDVVDRAFDVRFVAATNRNLEEMSKAGKFRSDLYYRVAVVRVKVPPLRERPEDVPLLVAHLVESQSGGRAAIGPEAMALLERYDWPGNARELRNVIQRALATSDGTWISPSEIFPDAADHASDRTDDPPGTFHEAKDQVIAAFERRYARALYDRHDGNVSRAAKESGLSRNAFYALMKRAGIEID